MSRDRHYRLAVTPLSPVHMGTDADYEPTGYVIDDGALFEFDGIGALAALPAAERERLGRILAGKADDRMLREVQGFFHANRERLIGHSRRQVRVNPTIEAFYKDRVGQVAQHEQGGRKVQNKLEIQRTAWNPVSGRPILPGSGLKGAIRTALLNSTNDGAGLRKIKDRRTGSLRDERNGELQTRLFDFRPGKFELDPMRLIHLGDAPLDAGVGLATRVWFALNRKKHPVEKNGVLIQSQAEQRNLYQLLECLPPLHPRAFAGSLTVQDLDPVGNAPNTPKQRFSIDEIALACNGFYRSILGDELELLAQRGYVDTDWKKRIERLLDALQPAFDAGRAFLLRAGRHSGAESVTLNGVRSIRIKDRRVEKGFANEIRDAKRNYTSMDDNVLIYKGEEIPLPVKLRDLSVTKSGELYYFLPKSKTLWLAGHERQAQRGLLPFGWLLVEIDPDGTDDPWRGFEPPAEDRDWLRRVQERVESTRRAAQREQEKREAELRRKAEEEAARRAAEEAERRRAAAEAARKAEEEAARRAAEEAEAARKRAEFEALPEAAKRLHRFQNELSAFNTTAPLNKDRFADLMGTINRLRDDAQAWSAEDRAQAADAIQAAFERFGWAPSGLKSDRRRKQTAKRREMIDALRNAS